MGFEKGKTDMLKTVKRVAALGVIAFGASGCAGVPSMLGDKIGGVAGTAIGASMGAGTGSIITAAAGSAIGSSLGGLAGGLFEPEAAAAGITPATAATLVGGAGAPTGPGGAPIDPLTQALALQIAQQQVAMQQQIQVMVARLIQQSMLRSMEQTQAALNESLESLGGTALRPATFSTTEGGFGAFSFEGLPSPYGPSVSAASAAATETQSSGFVPQPGVEYIDVTAELGPLEVVTEPAAPTTSYGVPIAAAPAAPTTSYGVPIVGGATVTVPAAAAPAAPSNITVTGPGGVQIQAPTSAIGSIFK